MSRSLRQKRKIAARYHQWVAKFNGQWCCIHDLPCGAFTGDLYFTGTKKECIEVAWRGRLAMFKDHEIIVTYG